MSGIQKHAVMSGVGAIIGQYVDGHRNAYLAERDAALRRYVELHPDDFPAPGKMSLNTDICTTKVVWFIKVATWLNYSYVNCFLYYHYFHLFSLV